MANATAHDPVPDECARHWNCYILEHNFDNSETEGLDEPHNLHDVLYNGDGGPLKDKCKSHCMRWVHLPANNMKWVEDMIARYYSNHESKLRDSRREKLLRRDFWEGQQHVGTGAHHARFMRSRCAVIPHENPADKNGIDTAETSVEGVQTQKEKTAVEGDTHRHTLPTNGIMQGKSHCCCCHCKTHDVEEKCLDRKDFVLFMPYLHWETEIARQDMAKVIKSIDRDEVPSRPEDLPIDSRDERLLRTHLSKELEKPQLHIRRTLDQSYYWTLQSTEERDTTQVVGRGTAKREDGENNVSQNHVKVVMVDQLWMWILDGKTILTSFPRRWGISKEENKSDSSGVHKMLRNCLKDPQDFKNVFDLALLIVDQCSRIFFDRIQSSDNRPEVMDIFASAIGTAAEKSTKAYERFWDSLNKDSESYRDKIKGQPEAEASTARGGIAKDENATSRELLDINPEGELSKEIKDILDELHSMWKVYNEQLIVAQDLKSHLEHLDGMRLKGQEQTIRRAADVVNDMGKRIAEVNELTRAAERTEKGLQNLLDLKQMQANVSAARVTLALQQEAQEQSNQGAKQNMSVLLFTATTIIFLPLSFVSGVFGMNAKEVGQGDMHISTQFAIMIPISLVIIAFSLLLAFSEVYRTVCAIMVRVLWAYFAKFTGLLKLWEEWGIQKVQMLKREEERRLATIYKRSRELSKGLSSDDSNDCDEAIRMENISSVEKGAVIVNGERAM